MREKKAKALLSQELMAQRRKAFPFKPEPAVFIKPRMVLEQPGRCREGNSAEVLWDLHISSHVCFIILLVLPPSHSCLGTARPFPPARTSLSDPRGAQEPPGSAFPGAAALGTDTSPGVPGVLCRCSHAGAMVKAPHPSRDFGIKPGLEAELLRARL